MTTLIAFDAHIAELTGLECASNLKTLYLGGNFIRDLSPLSNLSQLSALFLYRNQLTDLSPLAALLNLRLLDLRNNPAITNAQTVLAGLTGLTNLFLGGNAISNLAFLHNLNQLTFLELGNNCVSELSPLGSLPSLTGLDLSRNPRVEFAQVAALTNLTELYLSGNTIGEVTFLQNLTHLRTLSLCDNSLIELSPLEFLTELRSLNLGHNPMAKFASLPALTNLAALWQYGDFIETIESPMPPHLTHLTLDDNQIADPSPITLLAELRVLRLERNRISDGADLFGMTNLVDLSLAGNAIATIAGIEKLTRLASLNLCSNLVTDVSPLTTLPSLRWLDLGFNPVANYSSLSGLTNLSALSLPGDGITSANFLANLRRLTWLNLENNLVANPAPLSALTNLTSVNLGSNPISDWGFLGSFANLTSLRVANDSLNEGGFLSSLSGLSSLDLSRNAVRDLSFLSSLTNLNYLSVSLNRLTNIAPLQALPYLGQVDLRTNLLDLAPDSPAMAVIQSLNARWVTTVQVPQNLKPVVELPDAVALAINSTSHVSFVVFDDVTPSNQLAASVTSSNPQLLPNLSVGLTSSNRTLSITSAAQAGVATISLTVTDEHGSSTVAELHATVIWPEAVSIPDPHLENAIRQALDKPAGPLLNEDLVLLRRLSADGLGITNLAGLEWASNLTCLSLESNLISSVSSLENLKGLTSLSLAENGLTEISPLGGLTNLEILSLRGNYLSNAAAVTNLTRLISLELSYNLLDLRHGSSSMDLIDNLLKEEVRVVYLPQRGALTILSRSNWVIPVNTTCMMGFSIFQNGQPNGLVTVTATSSDTTLVPDSNLALVHSQNQYWNLAATPALNRTGSAVITLSAFDGVGALATAAFVLEVTEYLPPLSPSFNYSNLVWTTGGSLPWFEQSLVDHDNISAAQSGAIGDFGESWLATTVQGPAALSFWWKVSSGTNDFLEFYLNGFLQPNRISGEVDWQQQMVTVPHGPQTLRWRYSKSIDSTFGWDAGWLDEVNLTPLSWLEIFQAPNHGRCRLLIHGLPVKLIEVQYSSNLLDWSALGTVLLTNTVRPFVDGTASSAARYYRLLELPSSSIWLDSAHRSASGFQAVVHSPPGLLLEIQGSTNLANWTALAILTNSLGAIPYTDTQTNFRARFYRARAFY